MKTLLRLLLLLISLVLPTVWAADKTVLVVESYHEGFKWDSDYRQAISDALSGKYRLEFFEMDTKRLPLDRHPEMANKALARIQTLRPALVILGDDAALRLVGPGLDQTGIPGVYLGINNNPREYASGGFRHITGVLERPLFKRGMQFIRQIIPSTRKVLVLFDDNFTSEVIRNEVFENKPVIQLAGMEVHLKICPLQSDWEKAVRDAQADGYQVLVSGLHQVLRGPDGKVADAEKVITWTSANTPVPLFAFWDFDVGPEMAIGGLVMSGSEQGKAAAAVALRILEGNATPASIFPEIATQGSFVFSRRQLDRFHIALPPAIAHTAKFLD